MPHIQISKRRWINSDHIVEVRDHQTSPPSVGLYLSTNLTMDLIGNDASRFLAEYQRLCVAQQRPEVG